ncbi:MAG: hypothetical protein KKB31_00280 [Nanoarchaeota archaeon]|nr:hypothetical protein [Nanoarchaeota archaeon]
MGDKNKKGMLLGEETLKIVVALIAIVFLVYFLTALYFSKKHAADFEQAEATLERVSNIILSGESTGVMGINPDGWWFFGFTGDEKPDSCAGISCLCICEKIVSWNFWESQAEECSKNGVCSSVPGLRQFNPIKIQDPDKGITGVFIDQREGVFLREATL